MKKLLRSAGIALLAIAVLAPTADAQFEKCQRTIAKASSQFLQARVKALAKCEEGVVKKGTGACPDAKTTASVDKAAAKLAASINKSCGGNDKVCGVGAPGDLEPTAADLGFPATCPNFEKGDCINAIATCDDIVTCLTCIGGAASDQAISLYYDDLALPSTTDKTLNKCQISIGKATSAFLSAQSKALQKCWDARINGKHSMNCFAPDTGDGKYAAAIAKAEAKKVATICKACGGPDGSCAGGDNLTAAAIGFAATCPIVTIPGPGGAACGGPITDLNSIVACVDCVTEFKADCVDRLQVPQFTPYPTECNACTLPAPTGACPTSLSFTADGPAVDLDTGFTGLAHDAQVPSNGRITLAVSGCAGANFPSCGQCNVNGPLDNAGGVTFNNHRCKDASWIQCTSDSDCTSATACVGGTNNGGLCSNATECPGGTCTTAGSAGPCIYFFGAPLPLRAGGVNTCIVNEISGPVSGTINIDDGSSTTNVPLASKVHPTPGDEFSPCPHCVSNICDAGPRLSQACTINGSGQFGDVSLDCPPNPGSLASTLAINLNIATGTQSVTVQAANPGCRQTGYTGLKCLCDSCNSAAALGCMTNADCPDPSGPLGPICGGRRCIGGTNNGAACNGPRQCNGGANDFASCSNNSQCPGGSCDVFCTVVCSGGDNAGLACVDDSGCPGLCLGGPNVGLPCVTGGCPSSSCSGDCPTPACNRTGESTQPNSCNDSTAIPGLDCLDGGNNEGYCGSGPVDSVCSTQIFRSCGDDTDCLPSIDCPLCKPDQTCILRPRPCFTDNGVIGNTVTVSGSADAPCGGIAKPTVGTFFCVAPVSAAAVNSAGGLPGLGRVRIPGIVVIDP